MKKKNKDIFMAIVIGLFAFLQAKINFVLAGDYGLDKAAKKAGLASTGKGDIIGVVGTIIDLVLGYLGLVFLVLTIYGGLIWMTAGGNPENVKKAKSLITNAVIGLFIIFASYGIAHLVFSLVGVQVVSKWI